MLTACLIVRNESKVLARCLNSIAPFVDACCVVDSGSTDNTVEIARRHGAQVLVDPGLADRQGRLLDFSVARNRALAMAPEGWVLSIDADEVIHVDDAEWLAKQLRRKSLQALDVQIVSGGVKWYLPRLFRKRPWSVWHERVHEWIELCEPVLRTDHITITNCPDKTGKESAAERDLRLCAQILHEAPDNLRAVLYQAKAFKKTKHYAQAIPLYLRYWLESPYQAGRYTAVLDAAVCALLLGDLPAARRYAMAAYRISPHLAEACCVLGDVYLGLQRADLARRWFERALQKSLPALHEALFVDESAYGPYPRHQIEWIMQQQLTAQSMLHAP